MKILNICKIACVGLFVACTAIGITACSSSETVKASDKIVTSQLATVGEFTKIISATSVTVNVNTGADYSVVVTGPDNIIKYVTTEVTQGMLDIRLSIDIDVEYCNPDDRITVDVTLPYLTGLLATGQSIMNVNGNVSGDFNAIAAEQSTVNFSKSLQSTTVTLSGRGQSVINVPSAVSPLVMLFASGQAKVNVSDVETSKLSLLAAEQSMIEVRNAESVETDVNTTGQSLITLKRLTGTSAEADAAEQSTINITATDVAVNRTASDQATVNVTRL